LVVSRDGDFCVFDTAGLGLVARREIIGHPENRDDREQFVHLREYRLTASRLVPQGVVQWVLGIVDQVEGTQSGYLLNENDVYVMVPFGQHALLSAMSAPDGCGTSISATWTRSATQRSTIWSSAWTDSICICAALRN